MKKYEELIAVLDELCAWLDKGSAYGFSKEIRNIIKELEADELSDVRRRMLKKILSNQIKFDAKLISEVCVEGFSDEGKVVPWIDYIDKICALAEDTL